jgi:hypothetical protein
MDPRILHIAVEHALRTVAWDNPGQNEYVLVGDGRSIDVAKLQLLINKRFNEPVLWLSTNRHDACSFQCETAAEGIAPIVSAGRSLTLCDETIHRFLQVHPIGVARTGAAQANYSFKPNPLRGSA